MKKRFESSNVDVLLELLILTVYEARNEIQRPNALMYMEPDRFCKIQTRAVASLTGHIHGQYLSFPLERASVKSGALESRSFACRGIA
jgi:hypothetical protein